MKRIKFSYLYFKLCNRSHRYRVNVANDNIPTTKFDNYEKFLIFFRLPLFCSTPFGRGMGDYYHTSGYQDVPSGTEYPSKAEHPSDYYFRKQSGRTLQEYQLVY